MVSPIALFYSRMDGVLIPLAIQLYQTSSDTNPVSPLKRIIQKCQTQLNSISM